MSLNGQQEGSAVLQNLTKGGRLYLGSIPLGGNVIDSETTTNIVVEALRAKGVNLNDGKANAVDEDPDFVNENFYKEGDVQFFPFPMGVGENGLPVIYRDFDFWDYDTIGHLQIEFTGTEWKIYLGSTTNALG